MDILQSIKLFLEEKRPQHHWELSRYKGDEPYRLETVSNEGQPNINIDYQPLANVLEVTTIAATATTTFHITMDTIDLNDTDIQTKLLRLID